MKKIFVTGGNGFIGSHVVRLLVANGYQVKCLLRKTSKTHRLEGVTFEKCLGDVRDLDSLKNGMAGCDGVLHLASLSNWSDIHSPKMKEVVITGSRNVLEAAHTAGNLRTVYISSSTAIDGTDTPVILNEKSPFTLTGNQYSYAAAKKEVEGICQQFHQQGLPVMIVNPTEVYGPMDYEMITSGNLVDFAKSSPVLVTHGGTSVVYVEDVASGIIAAWEKGKSGERYILGSENLTVRQMAEYTLEILGQHKKIITMPNGLISLIAKIGGTLHIPLPFNPAVIPYAVKFWFIDNQKAKSELGIQFRSAKEALKPTLAWLKQEGYIK